MQEEHALGQEGLKHEILASEAKVNYHLTESNSAQATSASIQENHPSTTGENTRLAYNPRSASTGEDSRQFQKKNFRLCPGHHGRLCPSSNFLCAGRLLQGQHEERRYCLPEEAACRTPLVVQMCIEKSKSN
uniref:Uncharacterized protein n=1 Tax=Romanomermis culicivorax TaxID=13658 RepID=A0A915IAV0_ROMCU